MTSVVPVSSAPPTAIPSAGSIDTIDIVVQILGVGHVVDVPAVACTVPLSATPADLFDEVVALIGVELPPLSWEFQSAAGVRLPAASPLALAAVSNGDVITIAPVTLRPTPQVLDAAQAASALPRTAGAGGLAAAATAVGFVACAAGIVGVVPSAWHVWAWCALAIIDLIVLIRLTSRSGLVPDPALPHHDDAVGLADAARRVSRESAVADAARRTSIDIASAVVAACGWWFAILAASATWMRQSLTPDFGSAWGSAALWCAEGVSGLCAVVVLGVLWWPFIRPVEVSVLLDGPSDTPIALPSAVRSAQLPAAPVVVLAVMSAACLVLAGGLHISSPVGAGALLCAVGVIAVHVLPRGAQLVAGLTVPQLPAIADDAALDEDYPATTHTGHAELARSVLLGGYVGIGVCGVVGCVLMVPAGSVWAVWAYVAVVASTLLHALRHRDAVCLWALWVWAAIAFLGAAITCAEGGLHPAHCVVPVVLVVAALSAPVWAPVCRISPSLGAWLMRVEILALTLVLPLCLQVAGVFATIRGWGR